MTTVRIAGIGFRDEATLASVLDALDRAGAGDVRRLALAARKLGHPLAADLAARGHELMWIGDAALAATVTPTQSAIARRTYGTGSLSEAAALAAMRSFPGVARLVAPRALSADRLATAALATNGDPQ